MTKVIYHIGKSVFVRAFYSTHLPTYPPCLLPKWAYLL